MHPVEKNLTSDEQNTAIPVGSGLGLSVLLRLQGFMATMLRYYCLKIEWSRRSAKECICLRAWQSPELLERQIRGFMNWYNDHCYHEGVGNVTPMVSPLSDRMKH